MNFMSLLHFHVFFSCRSSEKWQRKWPKFKMVESLLLVVISSFSQLFSVTNKL